MKNLLFTIMFLTGISSDLYSQILSDMVFVDKKTKRIARKNTKIELDYLSDLLELKSRDKRIKKFELKKCKREINDKTGHFNGTPVGNFPIISGCPGTFTFTHNQNKQGSRYQITFFYDKLGNIVEKEISYLIVIY